VFRGRFELEAVEHVAAHVVDEDVAALLASLVDKSMVVADGTDPARFRMLEPLRDYAAQRFSDRRADHAAATRHARYYVRLAERLDGECRGRDELIAAKRFDAARDNLRSAFHTAAQDNDVATALSIVVYVTRYANTRVWSEPWSWYRLALELPGAADHPLRAAALIGMSDGAWQLGHHLQSVELADAAIALVEPGSTLWREAHRIKAGPLIWLGRFEDAVTAASTAVAGQPDEVTDATLTRVSVLALILNLVGRREPEMATRLLDDAHRLGNPTCLALAFHTAGVILGRDDRTLAIDYQRRAAELAAATGAVLIEGFALAVLAAEEADHDPLRGARAQLDVVMHYLRVGNNTHLRGFARSLLRPLVTIGAYEAAAVLDGATSDQPELGELAAARSTLITTAKDALGAGCAAAEAHGIAMTDDELVAYLDDVITTQENRQSPANSGSR
jgi:hypothetical protein